MTAGGEASNFTTGFFYWVSLKSRLWRPKDVEGHIRLVLVVYSRPCLDDDLSALQGKMHNIRLLEYGKQLIH
jgi:hypothetical protein